MKQFLRHVRTADGHDFYADKERRIFNIVPLGSKIPTGGYTAKFVLAIKGLKVFTDEEQARLFFLGVTEGKVFRNVNFVKRDYNCTNVVAAEILEDGKAPPNLIDNYEPADVEILDRLNSLYIQDGVRYYGFL